MQYLPLVCDLCRVCSLSCRPYRSRTMLSSRRRNPRTKATRTKARTTRMQTTRTTSQTPSDPSAETTKRWRPCVRWCSTGWAWPRQPGHDQGNLGELKPQSNGLYSRVGHRQIMVPTTGCWGVCYSFVEVIHFDVNHQKYLSINNVRHVFCLLLAPKFTLNRLQIDLCMRNVEWCPIKKHCDRTWSTHISHLSRDGTFSAKAYAAIDWPSREEENFSIYSRGRPPSLKSGSPSGCAAWTRRHDLNI